MILIFCLLPDIAGICREWKKKLNWKNYNAWKKERKREKRTKKSRRQRKMFRIEQLIVVVVVDEIFFSIHHFKINFLFIGYCTLIRFFLSLFIFLRFHFIETNHSKWIFIYLFSPYNNRCWCHQNYFRFAIHVIIE